MEAVGLSHREPPGKIISIALSIDCVVPVGGGALVGTAVRQSRCFFVVSDLSSPWSVDSLSQHARPVIVCPHLPH